MTMSDSETHALKSVDSSTGTEESAQPKKPKRKKNKDKDKDEEGNAALDPVRYKTKMCKNWLLHEKCAYGPRCLFAHGSKELRTCTNNHSAINSAVSSASPERSFYALGPFPQFMPVPFKPEADATETTHGPPEVTTQNPPEAPEEIPETQVSKANFTHSPYAVLPSLGVLQEECLPEDRHSSPVVPPRFWLTQEFTVEEPFEMQDMHIQASFIDPGYPLPMPVYSYDTYVPEDCQRYSMPQVPQEVMPYHMGMDVYNMGGYQRVV